MKQNDRLNNSQCNPIVKLLIKHIVLCKIKRNQVLMLKFRTKIEMEM